MTLEEGLRLLMFDVMTIGSIIVLISLVIYLSNDTYLHIYHRELLLAILWWIKKYL